MTWKVSVFREWDRKVSVMKNLKEVIGEDSAIKEAVGDWHARRKPRPCGLTVHPGIGCDYACAYCYIPDMGFSFKSKPYGLSGLQLAYAIASNPHVALGLNGTFLAYGSVTEPFLEKIRNKTYEYLKATTLYLGNPTQISTKAYISYDDALKLREITNGKLSILVTIITLRHYKKLEGNAPSPNLRFQTLYNLKRAGFNPVLFLRPIIPGVNDHELADIIEGALSYGIKRVLVGSLRVTFRILAKFRALNIPTNEIERRVLREPKSFKEQVPVKTTDIKRKIAKICDKLGVKVYYQACQVCAEDFNIPCCLPCSVKYECCRETISYDVDEVKVFLETLCKTRIEKIRDGEHVVRIRGEIPRKYAEFLRWVIKKKIVVIR
ncbi:MAG: DNA photolyase [Desulfurococcales archaeon ex4484_217_2]|nr:MAG: DNA photolyase [Desulfurococcales archaeon ex4484_217_2]